MADNVAITAGSGTIIATDDVSSVQFQKVKLDFGGDGLSSPAVAGGGTEATALRVTIATDSTGVLSVDDNGGSLTVDGTVELGATSLAALESLTTITTVTTVGAVTAITNALPAGTNNIGDVDVLTVIPGVGATNLGKAEDAIHASGDTGVYALTVRRDTAAATATTDGDYQGLATDANGRLHVLDGNSAAALTALQLIDNIVLAEDAVHASGDPGVQALAVIRGADTALAADGDYSPLALTANGYLKVSIKEGAGSGGTSATDDAAFTVASGSGTPIMGYAGADNVDANDVGVLRMTAARGLHTVAVSSTGTAIDPQADDAAFTPATSLVSVIAGIVTSDSVDSGDAGGLGMTTDRKLHTVSLPTTAGGPSIFRSIDIDETEEEIKGTAGQVYWIHCTNSAATPVYLKFYNGTAASVVVGTTTPVLTFLVPSQGTANGAGFVLTVPQGIPFSTAITVAATTGVADNNTGAPGANEVIVNVGYA